MGEKGQVGIRMTSYWTLPTAHTLLEALGLALEVGRGEGESKGTGSQFTMPSSHMHHVVDIWFHLVGRNNMRMDPQK